MAVPSQLVRALESWKDQAKDALLALSSCVCQQTATVKINGRAFQIVKVLGEGGFSFVYLAQDEVSGRQFALKKIRCPTGSEGVKQALREVEAYRRFKHPNIIRILDSAVVQDPDGEGKIVYLFLPLYKRGNLQDAINANVVNRTSFSEKQMLRLFRGTCEAVSAMHNYRAPLHPRKATPSSAIPASALPTSTPTAANSRPSKFNKSQKGKQRAVHDEDSEDEDEDDDAGAGYSYDGKNDATVPLVTRKSRPEPSQVVFDGDEEDEKMEEEEEQVENGQRPGEETVHVPYAHRDLKPGNVMIADDGATPILMDFGSIVKARIKVENRSQALYHQDLAAEQSTMTYRAPELFDVKTGTTLDEKVDIWSLGCTLYALAYSRSPFETTQTTEQGGSIAMAVLNAQYKHPDTSKYSQGLRDLIDSTLKVDPKERPDIHEVIRITDRVLATL
ncbi:other/NAK protein kinase [Amanita muscaria]